MKLCFCRKGIRCCCRPSMLFLRGLDKYVLRSKRFRLYRTFFMLLVTVTNVLMLPVRMAFEIPYFHFFIPIDFFLDIIYTIDIFYLMFLSTSLGKRERYLDWNYVLRLFWLDIISVLPLEVIPVCFGMKSSWWRMNKLIKFLYLNMYFSSLMKSVNFLNLSLLRFIQSCIFSILLTHMTACVYIVVMRNQGNARSPTFIPGEVDLFSMNLFQQYIRGFYMALITITGYFNAQPKTNAELIFSFVVSAYGVFIYIAIISGVGSLISEMDVSSTFMQQKMDEINEFFRLRKISPSIANPVRNYYNYLWKSRRTLNEEDILGSLPIHLRVELILSFIRRILRKVPFFLDYNGNLDPQFVNSMALKIRPVCAPPLAMIIRHGEIGKEMFFITKGKVEILVPPKMKRVIVLGPGKYFGDVAILLKNTKRTAWVRTLTYTDLYVINKDDFIHVLKSFPAQEKIVKSEAEKKKLAALMLMMRKSREEES